MRTVRLKLRTNGRNNSRHCWPYKRLTAFKRCTTTCNRVCKRTQYVISMNVLNVGSFWPTRLRPFALGLRLACQNFILGGSTPKLFSGHQRNVCTCRTLVLHIEPILQDTFRLQFHSRFKLEESRIVLL